MIKILADAHIPYLKGVAEQLGDVEYLPGNRFTREAIKDKDALIVRTVTRFDKTMLAGSRVQLICSATIGYDHIDTNYCDAHGIAWYTAPGCNADSVEQYVTASLLFLAQKNGFDLSEQTIGIVGVGNVGSKVATACNTLGMRVLLNDPPREEIEGSTQFTDLQTIKQEADIITFHTPLTNTGKHATYHLADDAFYKETAKKPFIINAARGGVTANQSLINALKAKTIAGAAIDCWENEPTINKDLLKLVDLATPHVAGYSADGKWNATRMSVENLKKHFNLSIKTNYQPIPLAEKPIIDLSDIDSSNQLAHAIWHTYDPNAESRALKQSPADFYHFRSHYPIRREYPAYRIHNADASVERIFIELGFQ